jgi:transposase InsO family protein
VVRLVSGEKTAQAAARFLRQLRAALAAVRVELTGIRTDRGPEFTGTLFGRAVAELDIGHALCPPRSPNHNAVVERFQGTVLHESYRPFFHRGYVTDLPGLDQALQRWTGTYNKHRPNHGDYMQGATPAGKLATLRHR